VQSLLSGTNKPSIYHHSAGFPANSFI